MPRIGQPKEISFEEIVKECFNRVEFRSRLTSIEVRAHAIGLARGKGSGIIETEFKKHLGSFLKELEDEIQETWNEKKLSFTRR